MAEIGANEKAVIDLGTNTFNLLIAELSEAGFHVIRTEREGVMLGMRGINEGRIAPDAMLRAFHALEKFQDICHSEGVFKIRCIGTSALREAKNSDYFLKEVKDRFGLQIEIISGEEEAQLIYQGTKLIFPFDKTAVIMDIGGGSTEFILADKVGLKNVASLDIGVSRVFQLFGDNEEVDADLRNRMLTFFDEKGKNILSSGFACPTLIGSSGSFETFYEMLYGKKYEKASGLELLPFEEFNELLDWTIHSSYEERLEHPWIIPIRKTLLPIAALKIKWAMELLGTTEVFISPYSLKEGAISAG